MSGSAEAARRMAARVAGSVILLDAVMARLLLRADESSVYFLNRPMAVVCAFRRSTGLPCPTCGISRAVVLALYGEIERAWMLAPAAPMAVVGMLALAVVLIVWAAGTRKNNSMAHTRARSWLRRGGLLYAAATLAVWLGGWMVQFWTAWHAR